MDCSAGWITLVGVCMMCLLNYVSPSCAPFGGTSKCCQGKDNKCSSLQMERSNRTSKVCFCDAACIDLNDCCEDYRQYCTSVDCMVSDEWQPWSECSVRCGRGVKQRTRRVIRAPLNGGRQCDDVRQKAICYGTSCKHARAPGMVELSETASLLPATFAKWRIDKLYNPYRDIRKNLFENYDVTTKHSIVNNKPSYCATYEITQVMPTCRRSSSASTQWTANFTEGLMVCAECQSTAMLGKLGGRCRGAGAHRKETAWNALGVPGCHGSWIMKTKQDRCECPLNDKSRLSVILV